MSFNMIIEDLSMRQCKIILVLKVTTVTLNKVKRTKKWVTKRGTKFEDYKKCLQNPEIILISQQSFKSHAQNVFTENVNKNGLSSNNNKRLDRNASYLHDTNI